MIELIFGYPGMGSLFIGASAVMIRCCRDLLLGQSGWGGPMFC